MATHTMQCNVKTKDLPFKKYPEVASDDFLGDLCILLLPDNANKVVNQHMAK